MTDMKKCYDRMEELERLSKQVKDILDCRIEAVLNEMSITALCDLPEDEPVTMEKFLSMTTDVVNQAAVTLAMYVLYYFRDYRF